MLRSPFARRQLLLGGAAALAGLPAIPSLAAVAGIPMQPRELVFPADHGAHPDTRTEWWYLTGYARRPETAREAPPDYGFQITFFRSRVESTQAMGSNFAARQLIFAHAALTDVRGKKLWQDQRIARSSGSDATDLASASRRNTRIELRDWSLKRESDPKDPELSIYRAQLQGPQFGLNLRCNGTQALLLQGDQGLSRKGPEARQTSFYYSQPQLAVQGQLTLAGKTLALQGTAWLDHEWSDEMLHPEAVGWDWIGMNLDDGSALTAFQIRDKNGKALWDGGSLRASKSGQQEDEVYVFNRGVVLFKPVRYWKSPLSQVSYPVEWQVRASNGIYTVRALVDNQELDSRATTGALYWEGLSELLDANRRHVGYGYLEMTGYAQPLRL